MRTRCHHPIRCFLRIPLLNSVFLFLARYPAVFLWPLSICLTVMGAKSSWGQPNAFGRVLIHFYFPSLLLAFLGCFSGFGSVKSSANEPSPTVLPRKLLWSLTAATLLFAVALRVWRIWDWPPHTGLGFEESQLGGMGWHFLHHFVHPSEHRLPTYAIAISFAFFGPSIFALRLPFMVSGMICPFLLFAVCRKVAAWEVSLFTLFLFSVSWWHLAATRIADEIFFPIVFELAVMWLLFHFADTGKLWAAFFTALFSGLLIYEYTSYHIVPFLVMAQLGLTGLAKIAWIDLKKEASRFREILPGIQKYGPGCLLMVVVWTTTFVPQIVTDISLNEHFFIEGFYRHKESGCGLTSKQVSEVPTFVLGRLRTPLLAAYKDNCGDPAPWLNVKGHPMFDTATALSLCAAILLVALTFWRRFHALLLLWLTVPVFVGSVVPCNENISRFYMVLPVLFVILALGWQVVWSALPTQAPRLVLLVLFGFLCLYSGQANLSHFFGQVCSSNEVRKAYRDPAVMLADWIGHREADSFTWLVSEDYPHVTDHPDLVWLHRNRGTRTGSSEKECIPSPVIPKGPLYYLLLSPPDKLEVQKERLHQHYPQAVALEPFHLEKHHLDVFPFRIENEHLPN